jgi:hypothetical protein
VNKKLEKCSESIAERRSYEGQKFFEFFQKDRIADDGAASDVSGVFAPVGLCRTAKPFGTGFFYEGFANL